MNYESLITSWLQLDNTRCSAFTIASDLGLNDWCLSAGFLRNLVWDNLHLKEHPTPLNDIDLVYFNSNNICPEADKKLENHLKNQISLPWSVKNQARMHIRNQDLPYSSTSDAMSFWPEIETAVGVLLDKAQNIKFIAPFGLENLFNKTITINAKRRKPEVFSNRVRSKNWQAIWPELRVSA